MKFAFKNRRRGKTREKRDASFQSFERYSSDFLKQRSGVELLLFLSSPSLALSLSPSLSQWILAAERKRAPLLSGFLALALLYSCCSFPFSLFEHEDVLVFNLEPNARSHPTIRIMTIHIVSAIILK